MEARLLRNLDKSPTKLRQLLYGALESQAVNPLPAPSARSTALRTGQVAVETGAVLGPVGVAFVAASATRAAEGNPKLASAPNAAECRGSKTLCQLEAPLRNRVRHPSGQDHHP
jgi:hypothetical protein